MAIESGCTAIVVGARWPENNGKIVRVGRFIGAVRETKSPYRDLWEVDQLIRFKSVAGNVDIALYCCPEAILQRLGGDETEGLKLEEVEICLS